MYIYEAEKLAGLEELLSAKSSIVYASLLEKSNIFEANKNIKNNIKALASLDDSDLYYTQSILVTTSWNKNDDIFDAREVWLAKDTPSHKPTNLEHNEGAIVGHIVSNWPITDEGELIEDLSVDQLPKKFHILTSSVIYTGYTEPELRERAQNLIAEIESGNKYVSMECFFKGFDYGLINKASGEYKILSRNKDTAFLTQHLRAYGGRGEHQNYKIGRVLREITFSGKGFVNKPANPESVIFTRDNLYFGNETNLQDKNEEKNDDFIEEGVFSNQANLKENNMSIDPEVTAEALPETTEPVVEQQAEVSVEIPATEETPVVETETQTEAAETKKEDEEKEEMKKKMETMKAALDEALLQLNSTNETLAAYKEKEEEMAKKEKKAKRVASLVESGITEEVAVAAVEKFELLDEETFNAISSLLSTVKVAQPEPETTKAEEKEDLSSALENIETESAPDLSVGSEIESELHNTRAALVDFVCTRLGKKLNKGE